MFKVKLSRAIDCADTVSLAGYEIDVFDVTDHDVNELRLECSGVQEFRLKNVEIEVDEGGSAKVSGMCRECNAEWEPFEGWIEFSVSAPLTEKDCQ